MRRVQENVSQEPIRKIYFAFPDGVFHYVCSECTALCCRGLGFGGSMSREMPYLLKRYPNIGAMVVARNGDLVTLGTPRGGCTFVQQDNRCQIEEECGKARKPLVCVLFPFNNLHRLQPVIVSPHFHCPLRLQIPSRVGDVEGTHEKIETVLRQTGVLDEKICPSWVLGLKTPRFQTASSVIERETSFRDHCATALGKDRFSQVLEGASQDVKALHEFRKRAARLMFWQQRRPAEPDAFDDVLLAISPALRIMNMNNTAEHQIRFLCLAESLIREYFADCRIPTPQSIHSVIQQSLPVLRLLAHENTLLKTRRKNLIGPLRSAELVFATSVAMRRLKTNGVLTALEDSLGDVRSRADRLAILNELARFPWTPAGSLRELGGN